MTAAFEHLRSGLTRTGKTLNNATLLSSLAQSPETDMDPFIHALGGAVSFRLMQRLAPVSSGFNHALFHLLRAGCPIQEAR